MPKMKTNKSVAKRFKITKTGKVMHQKAGKRHLAKNKQTKTLRAGRKLVEVSEGGSRRVRGLMPYA